MKYIFDVDGTLTPPRQVMDAQFRIFLSEFFMKNECYLASGSDFKKIKWQVGFLTVRAKGVFGCSGNEYYEKDKLVRKNDWIAPPQLEEMLKKFLAESEYPKRLGNHIEKRTGALNFSICGRDANLNDRHEYHLWESKNKERERIVAECKSVFDDITFDIGGEISIDIYPNGKDKSQIAKVIDGPITLFGDKIKEGGNDWTLAKALIDPKDKVVSVASWTETRDYLNSL